MRGWALVAMCAAGCTFDTSVGPDSDGPADPAADAAVTPTPSLVSRKPLTIAAPDFSDTPALSTGSLNRFPIAVSLTGDTDLAGTTGTFAVTAEDGETPLPFEVERFDASTGDALLWVSLPELAVGNAGGKVSLYLYYDLGAGSYSDVDALWDSYAAVWHLADDAAGGTFATSTSPTLEAQVSRGAAVAANTPMGQGLAFDRTQELGIAGAGAMDPGTGSLTYSMWVYHPTAVTLSEVPLYTGGYWWDEPGFDFELGTGEWCAYISDGVTQSSVCVDPSVIRADWAHLAAVVDRSKGSLEFYINGRTVGTDTLPPGALDSTPVVIGDSTATTSTREPFGGSIDEIRVSHVARTPQWIRAEYHNISTRSAIAGAAEQVDSPPFIAGR